jgi:LytS/YehU family sensor histidine kinase
MRLRTALRRQSWNDWITNALEPVSPAWLPWLWSAAVALAWPVTVSLSGYELSLWGNLNRAGQVGLGSLVAVLLMSVPFNLHAANRAHRLAAERREAEARLQLLQAQIEPHFLFNSLAHVLSLIEADPPQARALLEHFVDCLRASLGGLRQPSHTLGDELRLVRAYLQVQGHRMGDRLRVHWDVPDKLPTLPPPALLRQPLVENALQHGLEPALDGGSLWISARKQGQGWHLSVRDDGLGLDEQ